MKKIVTLVLAMALTLGMLAGCAPSATGPSQADLDAANAALATAKSDLEAVRADLTKAKADLEEAQVLDPTQIIDWYNESSLWRTVQTGKWSTDPADQMTEEEMDKIFTMAAKQQTAVQHSPSYFIVIRDPEEQRRVLLPADNANYNTIAGPGTVTVLVLEDLILSEEDGHVSPYREKHNFYMHTPWPMHNSGLMSGLLGFAAATLGYYTHYYAGVTGETAVADLAGGKYKSMSYYISEDDVRYMGVAYNSEPGKPEGTPTDAATYPVLGNCVLIGAIVFGKPVEGEPVETWATPYARPTNWKLWD